MPKNLPYIIRRKDTFAFRIGVPKELRSYIGCREIIRSLHTSNRKKAEPIALELAGKVKRLFLALREDMSKNKKDDNLISTNYEFELTLDEFSAPKSIKVKAEPHEEKAVNSAIKIAIESLNKFESNKTTDSEKIIKSTPEATATQSLSQVVESYISTYNQIKYPAMYKKLQTVIPMFLEIVGDKPINEIKQLHINHFFEIIQKLPPRWKEVQKKKKISIEKLSMIEHTKTISPKTFTSTYVASIRLFLNYAIPNYCDYGFPTHLRVSGAEYRGSRKEGENKQRPFKTHELKRLFEGQEIRLFSESRNHAHYYWLPHIGLFTGARVNEICQLNPQTDILKEAETNIWYFWITEETDADERVIKSTKNEPSRREVPIHSKLIELGFLNYLNIIKASGAKLIFPEWKPSRGKASSAAEKWFIQFIKEIGLRDETPHNRLVGMHALRSTLCNKAYNLGVNESTIVGHADEGSTVASGYRGKFHLVNKQKILEQINYDIKFIKPIHN